MSRINRIEFDLGETQGREQYEEDAQDNQDYNQDNNQDNQDNEYDSWEEMYSEDTEESQPEEVQTEEAQPEEIQPEQPLTEEEVAILKSLEEAKKTKLQKPTETDMEEAYNDFIARVEAEKKQKEDSMIREISIWVSNGNQVKGETLEEHYTYMTEQKIVQEKERKEQEEKERKEQAKKAEQALIAAQNRRSFWDMETTRKQKAGTTRPAHINGPNKLGREQGKKDMMRKKQLEAAEKMKKQLEEKTKDSNKRLQSFLAEEKRLITEHKNRLFAEEEQLFLAAQKEQIAAEEIQKKEDELMTLTEPVPLKAESQLLEAIKNTEPTKKTEEEWQVVGRNIDPKKKVVLDIYTCQYGQPANPTLATQPHTQTQAKFTRLCMSITTEAKCPHGSKCRYAHSLTQLTHVECAFGGNCRYAKQVKPGFYRNISDKKTGKICTFWHEDETEESYGLRMGMKQVQTQAHVPEPVKIQLKPITQPAFIQPAPKLAPWAKLANKPVENKPVENKPRKSRWDIKPVETKPVETKPRKSRWDIKPVENKPVENKTQDQVNQSEVMVIRVPRHLTDMAMEMALSKGVSFKIEFTD
jgi:hypothetical protein